MYAIAALTLLGFTLGLLLGIAAKRFKVESDPVVEQIEALLPGTNCGQCGLAGCPAAATALGSGEAAITLCPPGGKALVVQLAELLGVEADLDGMEDDRTLLARINESLCIGCVKCFQECPTDAIVGAPKQIHAVMWKACTGCKKCVDVCPTMCIDMFEPQATLRDWRWPKPQPAYPVSTTADAA